MKMPLSALGFLLACRCFAGGADMPFSVPVDKGHRWITVADTIKCLDQRGRTLKTIKRHGEPTWNGDHPTRDFRSTRFALDPNGKTAIVFDYAQGITTVSFFTGGCTPTSTGIYPNVELYHDAKPLLGGRGFLAVMTNLLIDCGEDCEFWGHLIHWDQNGQEKFKAGPYKFRKPNFASFHNDKYGYMYHQMPDAQGRWGLLFFDLVKGQYYFYEYPMLQSGGGIKLSEKGLITITATMTHIMPDGKKIGSNEYWSLQIRAKTEDEKKFLNESVKTIQPLDVISHEYQFP